MQQPAGPKVLIVDDDDDLRIELSDSLAQYGFSIGAEESAETVLAEMEIGSYPSAVVTDIRL